jgi:hypothetical protein
MLPSRPTRALALTSNDDHAGKRAGFDCFHSGTAVVGRLPKPLREGLAVRLGPIASAEIQTGGFTPGLAARLRLASAERMFVKGIPADHVLAGKYRAEADTARQLPDATPAPRLRWDADIAGWVVLAFDDIDGRHAQLAPGSPDIEPVVATIAGLAEVLTPCPVSKATRHRRTRRTRARLG